MVINFSLTLPRDEVSVPVVRRICRTALADLGVKPPCIEDIVLAVTEACTNVLKHAHANQDAYEVTVEVNSSNCEIRILDRGGGFDYGSHGHEEAHGSAESGRGIFLMKALVDKVDFLSMPDDGTVVRLQKGLELDEASVLHKVAGASA